MKIKQYLSALALTTIAVNSQANLIDNGGFEAPDVNSNNWAYFTDDTQVDGWSFGNSSMEIWSTPFLGVNAYEGTQIAELNAHGANNQAYGFFQSFDTVIGQSYNYSFAYSSRGNAEQSFTAGILNATPLNNTVAPYINLDINVDSLFDDHTSGSWSIFNSTFTASSTTSAIFFISEDNLGDTTGNLLDAVSVTERTRINTIPEPSSIALLALGIIGLGVARKKNL